MKLSFKKEKEQIASEAPVAEEVEVDRSDFNCEPCKGEGLVDDNSKLCPACLGKGKV